jgi:hypothetical protein
MLHTDQALDVCWHQDLSVSVMPVFSVESIAVCVRHQVSEPLGAGTIMQKTLHISHRALIVYGMSYARALRTQCDRSIFYLGDRETKWQPTYDVIRVFGLSSQLSKLSYR